VGNPFKFNKEEEHPIVLLELIWRHDLLQQRKLTHIIV